MCKYWYKISKETKNTKVTENYEQDVVENNKKGGNEKIKKANE